MLLSVTTKQLYLYPVLNTRENGDILVILKISQGKYFGLLAGCSNKMLNWKTIHGM